MVARVWVTVAEHCIKTAARAFQPAVGIKPVELNQKQKRRALKTKKKEKKTTLQM